MKPAVAAHEPLNLTGETLNLLAWHIPDLVAYQHNEDEWWFAPLDDNLPIIRLNRTGLEMLQAMNGHTTVGALVEKYGQQVCGPDGQPGQWHLEHWALPTFSLCYFGTEPPGGHRHKAKWDLLLQQIREGWSGREGFEGEEHLEDFHHHELTDSGKDDGHFDLIETTVSHLFREPSDTLNGLTYGRLLMKQLRKLGWFTPKPRVIVEVGGGLGYPPVSWARNSCRLKSRPSDTSPSTSPNPSSGYKLPAPRPEAGVVSVPALTANGFPSKTTLSTLSSTTRTWPT